MVMEVEAAAIQKHMHGDGAARHGVVVVVPRARPVDQISFHW
jgi:hypothetical protein